MPSRWLLLDQDTDAAEWGCFSGGTDGFVLTEDGTESFNFGQSPSATPKRDMVVVLFLPNRRNLSLQELPEPLKGDLNSYRTLPTPSSSPSWRAWCHFGGNISPSGENGPAARWKTWEGLNDACKGAAFAANSDSPPMPYSRNQTGLPWSGDFDAIRKAVRESRLTLPKSVLHRWANEPKVWREVLDRLQGAWGKAEKSTQLHARIEVLANTLPAVLSARFLDDALQQFWVDPERHVDRIVELQNSVGLPQHVRRFPSDEESGATAELRNCYDDARHAVVELPEHAGKWHPGRGHPMPRPTDRAEKVHAALMKLHRSICRLETSHKALSRDTTDLLRRNPHQPRAPVP